MKRHSRSSSASNAHSTQHTARSVALVLSAVCCLLFAGCESLQRKFIRKSKTPPPAPTPIIQFQDYSHALTPIDRYRKHSLIFDYWQSELLTALASPPLNPKRLRRDSADSLAELRVLQSLLDESTSARMAPLVEERARLNSELQSGVPTEPQARILANQLEAHATRLHRDFFWRDVEDHLKQ